MACTYDIESFDGQAAVLTHTGAFLGPKTMEVQLTDDQKAFIRDAIRAGRFVREEDALQGFVVGGSTRAASGDSRGCGSSGTVLSTGRRPENSDARGSSSAWR